MYFHARTELEELVRMRNRLRTIPLVWALLLSAISVFGPVTVSAVPAGNPAVEICKFEIADNLMYVPVSVNGSGPYRFLLDTGSRTSLISLDLARFLRIPLNGNVTMMGAGGQSAEPAWLGQAQLRIGKLMVHDGWIVARHLPLRRVTGLKVEGVLGFDVINSFVLRIDFGRRVLAFSASAGSSSAGTALKVAVSTGTPLIVAEITDGHSRHFPCTLVLDTGAMRGLTLNAPFSQRSKLPQSETTKFQSPVVGFGPETIEEVSRVESVRLGPYLFRRPLAGFLQSVADTAPSEGFDGFLGMEIIRRFQVVLDFKRGHVLLRKNRDFLQPFTGDSSGLFLLDEALGDDHVYTVHYVVPSSPAQEVGFQVGDVIRAINGHTISNIPLEKVRDLLRRDNRSYSVSVLRNGKKLVLTLRTRKLA